LFFAGIDFHRHQSTITHLFSAGLPTSQKMNSLFESIKTVLGFIITYVSIAFLKVFGIAKKAFIFLKDKIVVVFPKIVQLFKYIAAFLPELSNTTKAIITAIMSVVLSITFAYFTYKLYDVTSVRFEIFAEINATANAYRSCYEKNCSVFIPETEFQIEKLTQEITELINSANVDTQNGLTKKQVIDMRASKSIPDDQKALEILQSIDFPIAIMNRIVEKRNYLDHARNRLQKLKDCSISSEVEMCTSLTYGKETISCGYYFLTRVTSQEKMLMFKLAKDIQTFVDEYIKTVDKERCTDVWTNTYPELFSRYVEVKNTLIEQPANIVGNSSDAKVNDARTSPVPVEISSV